MNPCQELGYNSIDFVINLNLARGQLLTEHFKGIVLIVGFWTLRQMTEAFNISTAVMILQTNFVSCAIKIMQ